MASSMANGAVAAQRSIRFHRLMDAESPACVTASDGDYDKAIARAQEAFLKWRTTPGPVRGDTVRRLGNALRELKHELGQLVTLETGKIIAEGEGEVQEMIDICDFAVGQSRMLYGLTIQSERPSHRLMEQWHPLGSSPCNQCSLSISRSLSGHGTPRSLPFAATQRFGNLRKKRRSPPLL